MKKKLLLIFKNLAYFLMAISFITLGHTNELENHHNKSGESLIVENNNSGDLPLDTKTHRTIAHETEYEEEPVKLNRKQSDKKKKTSNNNTQLSHYFNAFITSIYRQPIYSY